MPSSLVLLAALTLLGTSFANSGCQVLSEVFPGKVFQPSDDVYKYENGEFWSNTELLSPACIFRPTSTQDVSAGLIVLDCEKAPFAVRGGGHMGIKGANNIDNGVLIVLSNLTMMEVSPDQNTLNLGPAFRWGQVYPFLQEYNLTVGGGRLAPVGVPGLLLGGGVNFYGNQFGFSADQVIAYEVVLANGTIVKSTATKNSDLFWALKGGSSNFGIVTQFTMKTIPSKKVWAGIYSVSGEHIPEFLSAIANYSASITDPLSHIVPAVIPSPNANGTEISYIGAVIIFYDSETVTYPACFKAFTSIPAIANTLDFKTVTQFTLETGTAVTDHINDVFVSGTAVGNTYEELLQAVTIINDVFFGELPKLYAQLPPPAVSIIELDWQPIGSLWLDASSRNGVGGNPLGLDASKVYLCYAQVVEWFDSKYDAVVAAWVESTQLAINNATQAAGLYDPFNYMGDSTGFQPMFSGYGHGNEEKLLSISRKYDPKRVFQTLMPGGFKIGK